MAAIPFPLDATLAALAENLTHTFLLFTLVVTRISGLLVIGPLFGHPDIPLQLRVFLVLVLALLLTPLLPAGHSRAVFARLDADRNGLLTTAELPDHFLPAARQLREAAQQPDDAPLTPAEFQLPLPNPRTPLDYLWLAAGEFGIGAALGFGVLISLSALQFAGYLIDQQTGVSLGEIFNPELDSSSSLTGETLHQLGMVVFLASGGHLLLIQALVATYQLMPVGHALVTSPVIELLGQLLQGALVLTFQIAAPIFVCMSLVSLAMGFMGHTVPQLNVLMLGFPIRALIGLFIVFIALTRMAELLAGQIPDTVERISSTFGA